MLRIVRPSWVVSTQGHYIARPSSFQRYNHIWALCRKAGGRKSLSAWRSSDGSGTLIRCMCNQARKEKRGTALASYRKITYYILTFSTAVGIAAYILSHLSIRLTKYFTKVTFVDSWKFGVFFGGFLSGTIFLGLGLAARHLVTISPDRVFRQSMRYIVSSSAVRDHLGTDLHTGMFKAYSYRPRFTLMSSWRSRDFVDMAVADVQTIANTEEASFRSRLLPKKPNSPDQPAGHLRLLFQLSGGKRDAMVCVDAHQNLFKRNIVFSSLAVTDTKGHCIVLLGKPGDVFYQGKISLR